MHKKKYKAIIPSKVKDINAVNSLLIKLRYYWEMVEVHKRKGSKPDEKKYLEFLKMYRHTANKLRSFGVEIRKRWDLWS